MTGTRDQARWAVPPLRETTDPPWPLVTADADDVPPGLARAWAARWPGHDPVGNEIRTFDADLWVRFHSLPGSKRYPDTEAEYVELLRRHRAVIDDLLEQSSTTGELTLIVGAWPDTDGRPRGRDRDLPVVPSRYWRSVCTDTDPDVGEIWLDLFVARVTLDSPALDTVLRRVAAEALQEVIITDSALSWLYHPYDGGGDVVASSPEQRDRLKAAHRGWLSAHPQGF